MFLRNHLGVYWNTDMARSLKITSRPSEEGTAWAIEMGMDHPLHEVAYFTVGGHFEEETRKYFEGILMRALPGWERDIDGVLWNMSRAYQVEAAPSFGDPRYKFAVRALFHNHPRADSPKFRPSATWEEAQKNLEDMLMRLGVCCS